jgi:ABC-type polysaccharide/polyol phosphate transport system ATPase subunit
MNEVMIRVESLSKCYRRLVSGDNRLSEVMANLGQGLLAVPRRLWHQANGRRPTAGGTGFQPRTVDFWALRDVTFDVKRGEVFGVIGRNGAGKSTLLKVLSRITEPTSGRFGIAGRVGSLLEVGTGFHPELTGRENIFLSGSILGMSRAEVRRKFDDIVSFAETSDFLDTPVKRYSSGMQTRLGFAVAAHLEPEILIIDEVLAVGDATFQKKCMRKVQEISSRDGCTVLLVNHNLPSIRRLCHRALWLDKGTQRALGEADHVATQYELASGVSAENAQAGQPPLLTPGREPRAASLPVTIDFTRDTGDQFAVRSGQWYADSTGLHALPAEAGDAVATLVVERPLPLALEMRVTIRLRRVSAEQACNASILFDYQSPDNHAAIGLSADANEWTAGRFVSGTWIPEVNVSERIMPDHDYELHLSLRDRSVSLTVSGRRMLTYELPPRSNGLIGLATRRATADFKNLTLQMA